MQNLTGKVVTAAPANTPMFTDYIVAVQTPKLHNGRQYLWLIPAKEMHHSQHARLAPYGGPMGWQIRDVREDDALIGRVIHTLQNQVDYWAKCVQPDLRIKASRGKENLEVLRTCIGRRHALKLGFDTEQAALDKVEKAATAGFNLNVAAFDCNYVGQIVFIEMPLTDPKHADKSGEYIVVEQSADSLYCVSTDSMVKGSQVVRIVHKNPHGPSAKLLRKRIDPLFIDQFAGRLQQFSVSKDAALYAPEFAQGARQVAEQLRRLLKRDKVPNPCAEIPLMRSSSAWPTPRQAEDRMMRVSVDDFFAGRYGRDAA